MIDGRGEAEAVKHAIWGVLFSWPRPVYYFSALLARESQLSFSTVARKLALSGHNTVIEKPGAVAGTADKSGSFLDVKLVYYIFVQMQYTYISYEHI